jgi:predicted nucleotidyltransferase
MKTKWPKNATPQQRAAAEELMRRLQKEYPGRILRAVLFGSVARGTFSDESDLDVLVLTDRLDTDTKWSMWGVAARVSLDFDVILDPHIYPRELWESLRAQGRALCHNIEREGIELRKEAAPAITVPASPPQ